ncbi:hypothetical protein [Natrinema sp. DC36]|uniref:hypothetical protein n=1 Tax=Natrinema sp. DC36 TaxID=2878680 RepID=UPI001CF02B42|nr:hypothetical protein [Natrinema sp. DC36]
MVVSETPDADHVEQIKIGVAEEHLETYPDKPDDHPNTITGEAEVEIAFADGVEYDLDVGPDGNIIIQYWKSMEAEE